MGDTTNWYTLISTLAAITPGFLLLMKRCNLSKKPFKGLKHVLIATVSRLSLANDMNIPMVFEYMAILAKILSGEAFDPISCRSVAYFTANGDSKATAHKMIGTKIGDKLSVSRLFAKPSNTKEFRPLEQSVGLAECLPCY